MSYDYFKQAYRKWFAQQDEQVPESVWNSIQDQLDIDDVWSSISDQLDAPIPGAPAAAGGSWSWLVLPFVWLAIFVFIHQPPLNPPLPVDGLAVEELPGAPDSRQHPGGRLATSEIPVSPSQPATLSTLREVEQITQLPTEAVGESTDDSPVANNVSLPLTVMAIRSDNSPLEEERATLPLFDNDSDASRTLNDLVIADQPNEGDEDSRSIYSRVITPEKLPVQQWLGDNSYPAITWMLPSAPSSHKPSRIQLTHVGIMSGIKNTWLFCPETAYGLRSESLSAVGMSWAPDVGVQSRWLIQSRHQVGVDLLMVSPSRQVYKQYINAYYQQRSLQLDFQRLQAYMMFPINPRRYWIAGAYVARLSSATEVVGPISSDITDLYTQIDYGLLAGYQEHHRIGNRWEAIIGVRAIVGLPNIYAGSAVIPASFNATREAGWSVVGGIHYRLHK